MAYFTKVRYSSMCGTHLLGCVKYYVPWNEVHKPALHSERYMVWLIRRVLDDDRIYWTLMPLATTVHKLLTHCHLLPTGHSIGTTLTSNWTGLHYSVVLPRTPSIFLIVSSYNYSARIPRKTPSSVVNYVFIGTLPCNGLATGRSPVQGMLLCINPKGKGKPPTP
jgi:hypothetical protein